MKFVLLAAAAALMMLGVGNAAASPAPSSSPLAGVWTVESAATTNATIAKSTPAALYGFSLCNNSAAAKFFKFYDKATAPTVGTDAVYLKVQIPANSCRDHTFIRGAAFLNGLGFAITGAEGNSDTTAVGAGDVSGTFDYK